MKLVFLLLLLVFISCENSNEIEYINDNKENENELILKDALTDFYNNIINILKSNDNNIEKDFEEIANLWESMSQSERNEILSIGTNGIISACNVALSKQPFGGFVCSFIVAIIGA